MKYDGQFPFASALPDAPLRMPKQALERQRSFFITLRDAFAIFAVR